MPRVTYDPAGSSIIVDFLLESVDGPSSLLIPVVLDTGASLTIVSTELLVRLGYDPATPLLQRQRIVTGSGIEYAPRITVRAATALGQTVNNLRVLRADSAPVAIYKPPHKVKETKEGGLILNARAASSLFSARCSRALR